MISQEIIGLIAFLIGVGASVVYLVSVFKGRTKPHLFTWIVWGIIASIGYLAQLHDHAGPGAWAMGWTAASCFITAMLAVKYGEKNITRSDWIALVTSLSCILPWLLTSDPLGSVILISIIDVVAFYPTFRKSWNKPQEEHLTAYHLANLKLIISLFAMTNFTVTTTLYAITIIAANSFFIAMCYLRRRYLSNSSH